MCRVTAICNHVQVSTGRKCQQPAIQSNCVKPWRPILCLDQIKHLRNPEQVAFCKSNRSAAWLVNDHLFQAEQTMKKPFSLTLYCFILLDVPLLWTNKAGCIAPMLNNQQGPLFSGSNELNDVLGSNGFHWFLRFHWSILCCCPATQAVELERMRLFHQDLGQNNSIVAQNGEEKQTANQTKTHLKLNEFMYKLHK